MGQRWKLIKMLKFKCKMSLRSKCWNLSEKGIQIDQNAEIWMTGGNQWKIWNLETKSGINQNAANWVLMDKSIKMLKFEWKGNNQPKCWNSSAYVGIDQNVEIWEKKRRSIKCWYFIAKVGINQNVGILLKVRNWSEYWHLSTKKVGNWSKCWNLSKKAMINQNVEIWVWMWESIKILKFERKLVKGQIYQMLKFIAKVGIKQNFEIWV